MSNFNRLRVATVCEANPAKNPRPNRVIQALQKDHELTAIGRHATQIEGVEVLSYDSPKKRNFWQEIGLYRDVFLRRYERLVFIPTRLKIAEYLDQREFDLIFCHDLVLLPIVLAHKKSAKVIFDAREFYPKQCEDDWRWKILFADFNDWLCRTFLKEVDCAYTVGEGIAQKYGEEYGVKMSTLMSLPLLSHCSPALRGEREKIRLIHHGVANSNRQIELMIEMMDHVDDRFVLDLMLMKSGRESYYESLMERVKERQNVRLIPPVTFEEIIPFINQYDIGLYLLPPTGFNTKYALPNKFFEFIQARLAIAIGPSPEMARIVQKENLGIISKDFTPLSMAKALNQLTHEEILAYKQNADRAAKIYNAKENEKILQEVMERALCQKS